MATEDCVGHTMDCRTDCACPLSSTCARVMTRRRNGNWKNSAGEHVPTDILFVLDHAGFKDLYPRQAFSRHEGVLVGRLVERLIPEKDVAFTYLVRGWPVDESTLHSSWKNHRLHNIPYGDRAKTLSFSAIKDKKKILDQCLPYFLRDVEYLKPKLIVAMGNSVKDVLFPSERKTPLMRMLNTVKKYRGIPTRFIADPVTMLRNPSSRVSWEKQFHAVVHNKTSRLDTTTGQSHVIGNLQEALDYIDCLEEVENDVSIDIETLNLNKRYGNRIATIQFSETNGSGVVIPYNHPESPFAPDEVEVLRKRLYKLFREPSKITHWVGHNLKFECNVLRSVIGTPLVSAPLYDTQLGAFLLDENRKERVGEFLYGIYTLKQLAYDYLNFNGYDQGILAVRSEGNLFDLPLRELAQYGAMDTYITRRLMHAQLEEARKQDYLQQLLNLMYFLYTPMILLFSDIEYNGFFVGISDLRKLVSKKTSPLLKAVGDICREFKSSPQVQKANKIILDKGKMRNPTTSANRIVPLGKTPWVFNLAKEGHPQTLFFDVLGLPKGKVGKSGMPSVSAEWQNHNKDNPFVAKYIEYQSVKTLYNVFATKLYQRIDPGRDDLDCNTDQRIRPSFLLFEALTGRTACKEPNLQNIPRSDSEAKKGIKNIFQALPEHVLVQLDYKANEVRWVGILAQEDSLAKRIWQGKKMQDEYRNNPSTELLHRAEVYGDVHKQMASMVFEKPLEEVTKDERQASKAIQFGILYGSSIRAIAEAQKKSEEVVQSWFDKFYERFPKIKEWKKRMETEARTRGYVEAAHGRRRRFPAFQTFKDLGREIPREFTGAANAYLRQAVNSPIQGIASDCGMCGAALFARYIRENGKPWQLCNAVHDSAVYQVRLEDLRESLEQAEYWFTEGVMEYMAGAFNINFNLPLEVDFEIGLKWGEMTKWNFNPDELNDIKEQLRGKMKVCQLNR